MDKTLQTTAWNCLPREFREEVKEMWQSANKELQLPHDAFLRGEYSILVSLFGYHNLTSDAEGEEMLYCEKSKVQYRIQYAKEGVEDNPDYYNGYAQAIYDLFGSKCLPDEEPKPAEPKFKIGDEVVWDKKIIAYVDENLNDGDYIIYSRVGNRYTVHESDLEPYTEPTCTKTCTDDCLSQCKSQDCDKLIQRGFRDHNRLHIAAMIMSGLYANELISKHRYMNDIVRIALNATDILIRESKKGGENDTE